MDATQYQKERNKPAPSVNHSIIQGRLLLHLNLNYGKQYEVLPEVDFEIFGEICVPDLILLPPVESLPPINYALSEIPKGVIVILNYGENLSEIVRKSANYFKIGVKSYWLVLPDLRSIYIFDKANDYQVFTWKDQLKDDLLGIELDLKEIFRK